MYDMEEPLCAWATDPRDKYDENHDSGYAGRICMQDGNLVWAAVIADGCGGSIEGLKVSGLAIQAFTEAIRCASVDILSSESSRRDWAKKWMTALHEDASFRFRGGMSTFAGAIILPPEGSNKRWKLVAFNVGDSKILFLDDAGRAMGINPDAPANNPNVEGNNPVRVVGVAPKGEHLLMDMEEFPLPASGKCYILSGSDGFFARKHGKVEVQIFGTSDFKSICQNAEAPFHELPALFLRRSMENAKKLDVASMMDNATIALLGFRVPNPLGIGVLPAVAETSEKKKKLGVGKWILPVATAIALVVGLFLGIFIGKGSRKARPDEQKSPKVSEESVKVQNEVPEVKTNFPIPDKRCERCEVEYSKNPNANINPFHWRAECTQGK